MCFFILEWSGIEYLKYFFFNLIIRKLVVGRECFIRYRYFYISIFLECFYVIIGKDRLCRIMFGEVYDMFYRSKRFFW